jgi:hypothetical protein
VLLDFKKPFDLIPEYKSSYDKKVLAQKDFKNPSFSSKIAPSNIWSQLLNAVRTYFETSMTKI